MKQFWIGILLTIGVSWAGLQCLPEEMPSDTLVPLALVVDTTRPPSVSQEAINRAIRQDYGHDVDQSTTTQIPVALVDPSSPCQEWVPLAVQMGWPQDREVIERLVNIMWRESRCQPGAYNATDPHGGSYGLLQLNGYWCSPSQYSSNGWLQDQGVLDVCSKLYDPATNLKAAWLMYSYSIQRNGGDGWNPWN